MREKIIQILNIIILILQILSFFKTQHKKYRASDTVVIIKISIYWWTRHQVTLLLYSSQIKNQHFNLLRYFGTMEEAWLGSAGLLLFNLLLAGKRGGKHVI